MARNFHLFAAPAFLAILGLTYVVGNNMMAKKERERTSAAGYALISVSRATWGENCNDVIDSADPETLQGQKPVEVNNVLERVSLICNGKKICQFPVKPEMLGNAPVSPRLMCAQQLDVEYRCNRLGLPIAASAADGKFLQISCEPKPVEKTKEPASKQSNAQGANTTP
jgi:hypothetical protein